MLMIFVNNGAGDQIFHALQHSRWNGMTPCDLVFPFFLFIMGMSTYLSLRKTGFAPSRQTFAKIGRRTLLLFAIGLMINWFDMACNGHPLDFAHLRIMGVMQRIALCYGATALLAVACTQATGHTRFFWPIIAVVLGIYGLLLLIFGGYHYDASTNFLAIIDTDLLGYNHLYHKSPVDPEGLVSTFSAIAHTMTGFAVARWALDKDSGGGARTAYGRFVVAGMALTMVGLMAMIIWPLNKRIWSPSYVLLTCGLASLAQAMLVYLVDIARHPRLTGSRAWRIGVASLLVFGTNPLLLYLASEAIAIVFGATGTNMAIYTALRTVITNGYWASVAYASLFVSLHLLIGLPLWRKKVYIKI